MSLPCGAARCALPALACVGLCLTTACADGAAHEHVKKERPAWKLLGELDFGPVPAWTESEIDAAFVSARDSMAVQDEASPGIPRRISWLYPDSGCESRAELIAYRATLTHLPRPYKLFVIGTLEIETANSPSGLVRWDDHVAPIVKNAADGSLWMLDPAIDPDKPLSLEAWVSAMSNGEGLSFLLDDGHRYRKDEAPSSFARNLATALNEQQHPSFQCVIDGEEYSLLTCEEQRQLELERNPREVLGEDPPWSRSQNACLAGEE